MPYIVEKLNKKYIFFAQLCEQISLELQGTPPTI